MPARFFVLLLCIVTFTAWGCASSTGAQKTVKDPKEAEASHDFYDGLMAMQHQNWPKAEKKFQDALAIRPRYNTRLYLAEVYEREGKKDEAVHELREAIKQNGKDSKAYTTLIDYYYNWGQVDKAIAAGEEAISNGASSDAILINLGWVYYVSGDNDKAEKRITAAGENSKNDSVYFNDLGLVMFSQGRYEDALTKFKEADRLNPKSELVPYFLAHTYSKLGRESDALAALEAGFKKDPDMDKKAAQYDKTYFPHTDPGDLSALLGKAKVETPAPASAKPEKPATEAPPGGGEKK